MLPVDATIAFKQVAHDRPKNPVRVGTFPTRFVRFCGKLVLSYTHRGDVRSFDPVKTYCKDSLATKC